MISTSDIHYPALPTSSSVATGTPFSSEHFPTFAAEGEHYDRHFDRDAQAPLPPFPFMQIRLNETAPKLAGEKSIERYLDADGIDELYGVLLDRLEQRCGRPVARDLLGCLWGSRRGLTRAELAKITGRREHATADAIAVIENHLLWDESLISLPDSLRHVVEERYVGTPERRRAIHMAIAAHFANGPIAARRAEEQPWQLHEARAWGELLEAIVVPAMTIAIQEREGTATLYAYWSAIARRTDPTASYESRLEAHRANDRECLEAATIYQLLGEFQAHRGDTHRSEWLLRRSLAIRLAILGEEDGATEEVARAVNHISRREMAAGSGTLAGMESHRMSLPLGLMHHHAALHA